MYHILSYGKISIHNIQSENCKRYIFYDIIRNMNKKPGLFFTICALAMILLAAHFGMGLGGADIVKLRQGIDPNNVLYVCPVDSGNWSSFAESLSFAKKYIFRGFLFVFIILVFNWAWALYQNLVKDKFSADAYKNPWGFTKIFFWAAVICTILSMTPNYFRTVHVHVKGHVTNWVLCENNSANARPVNPKAVTLH